MGKHGCREWWKSRGWVGKGCFNKCHSIHIELIDWTFHTQWLAVVLFSSVMDCNIGLL